MNQQQLDEEVLSLGNLVEDIVISAADMLPRTEPDAMERLDDAVQQVHKGRLAIEMSCLSSIISRRPLDGQLRLFVAMIEIAAELERVADHGQRVARASHLGSDAQLRKPLASLHRLASEVQSLLDRALVAFAQRDADAARTVRAETQEIERPYQQVRDELLIVMKSQSSIANQAIYLSRAAYHLRRAAERAASICDWVVFAVEGSVGASEPTREAPARRIEEASVAI
jgi:phosphate transport system protein